MNLLLDTHMLIWMAEDLLPKKVKPLITDVNNILYFSAASIWEIGVKRSSGRQDFTYDPAVLRQGLLDLRFKELPITGLHCLAVADLPLLHKDPFDRILIAQAKSEGIPLLTADKVMRKYQAPVMYFPR